MHPCQSYHYCLKKFFILDLFLCCLGSSLKMLTVGEREQKFSFFSSRCSCYFQLERSSKKNNQKLKKNWKTLMTGKFKRSEHKKPVSFNIERWMRRIRIWKYIASLAGQNGADVLFLFVVVVFSVSIHPTRMPSCQAIRRTQEDDKGESKGADAIILLLYYL